MHSVSQKSELDRTAFAKVPAKEGRKDKSKHFNVNNKDKQSKMEQSPKEYFKRSKRKEVKQKEKNTRRKTSETKLFENGVLPK